MSIRHFIHDLDLSAQEQSHILDRALTMKANPHDYQGALSGKILGMMFAKQSTRTRVSFEAGMIQLGGHAIFLSTEASQLGRGEPITDTGQVLSRYVDCMMIRTFDHNDIERLAQVSTVPVINGLDDLLHPCQALADLLTMREEKGTLEGQQLVYVGDGNNMAHSLMLAGGLAGMHVRIITPPGCDPDADVVSRAREQASERNARIETTNDLDGVAGADAVYTDVWASMGQEAEAKSRRKVFAPYQINEDVMLRAKADAIFLHCLPAHRGEEVSAGVIDGPKSRVFDQAENRLHVQKSLLTFCLRA